MGNCQAIDAAALVIQHPNGKIERLYWPVLASEVMKTNPGHYVSLIIPLPVSSHQDSNSSNESSDSNEEKKTATVQFTRVKLLRPTDTLALGHAYRLVTTQEVMKVLRAKKYAKMKRQNPQSVDRSPERQRSDCEPGKKPHVDKDKVKHNHQATRHRPRAPSINSATLRSKSWRPTLNSISEATS